MFSLKVQQNRKFRNIVVGIDSAENLIRTKLGKANGLERKLVLP
jgi:hypothetical protein